MAGTVDIHMPLPLSFYTLTNDVIHHGVIHMLVPPVELITEWIDKEKEQGIHHFQNDKEEQQFLSYMEDLLPPSVPEILEQIKEDDADDAADDADDADDVQDMTDTDANADVDETDVDPSKVDPSKIVLPDEGDQKEIYENEVHPKITQFSSMVAQKVIFTLFDRLFPLFMKDEKDDLKHIQSIPDLIQSIAPKHKATELEGEMENVLFDLLVSIKRDLESDEAKQLLAKLKETDGEYVEYHNLLEKLMKKYNYESFAIKKALERLKPLFMKEIDETIEWICGKMQQQIPQALEEYIVKERNNIPGPMILE